MGFEPTETQRTSTAFEAVPFVRSGILPSSEASGSRLERLGRISCLISSAMAPDRPQMSATAAGGEELDEQRTTFVGSDAGRRRDAVVEQRTVEQVEATAGGT